MTRLFSNLLVLIFWVYHTLAQDIDLVVSTVLETGQPEPTTVTVGVTNFQTVVVTLAPDIITESSTDVVFVTYFSTVTLIDTIETTTTVVDVGTTTVLYVIGTTTVNVPQPTTTTVITFVTPSPILQSTEIVVRPVPIQSISTNTLAPISPSTVEVIPSPSSALEVTLPPTPSSTSVETPPIPSPSTSQLQPPAPTLTLVFTSVPTSPLQPEPSSTSNGSFQSASYPGGDGNFLFTPTAIAYAPIEPTASTIVCRTQPEIQLDMELLSSKGIREIRVYSTECNAISNVLPAAALVGIKVIQGFYFNDTYNNVANDIAEFISWAKSNDDASNKFDVISAICIGNQAVTNNWISADDMTSLVQSVRSELTSAVGYKGEIIISETSSTYVLYPSLCDPTIVDYAGFAVEPFLNPYYAANETDSYVNTQISAMQNFCPNINYRVIESGYPNDGVTYGLQVPSFENQGIAVTQIYNVLQGDVVLYTMWNESYVDPGFQSIGGSFGLINRFD